MDDKGPFIQLKPPTELDLLRAELADLKRIALAAETKAARWREMARELAGASIDAIAFLYSEYVSEASHRAYDAELGASEWAAFMPEAWHKLRAALAAYDDMAGTGGDEQSQESRQ